MDKMKRVAALIIVGALIPATILVGFFILDDRKYFFISMLIVLYCLVLFFMLFEFRKPHAREVVVISVLIAIAVAGRAVFFMTPNFKPMVALVIIGGASLGRESGFIIGAMSGFVSNFIFGQGPWTPWQMFALGLIGYLSGLLFSGKGNYSKKRIALLCIYGAFATFILYSGIVDIWTVLGFTSEPSVGFAISVYTLAIPFNLIHTSSTIIFLLLIGRPMIEKLERVKVKFGLRLDLDHAS